MIKYALYLLSFLLVNQLSAQPFNMDKKIRPIQIKLFPFNPTGKPTAKGNMGIAKVTQTKDTAYFYCKGISVYSPVITEVFKKGPSSKLKISLHKWNWKEAGRKGETDEKGLWSVNFKTENDFGIMVVNDSGEPVVYNLIVWAGQELKMKLPSAMISYDEYEKNEKKDPVAGNAENKKGKSSNSILFIAIGGVVLAVLVFVFMRRNKVNKTAILILFLLGSAGIFGQGGDEPSEFDVESAVRAVLSDPDGVAADFASINDFNQLASQWAGVEEQMSLLGTGLSQLSTAISTIGSLASGAVELYSSLTALDNGECSPDFTQSVEGMMPSTCLGSGACMSCYDAAIGKLDGNRQTLARMWCIYNNTKRFRDKAVAFGNSVASIGGGVGFGWPSAKKQIEDSYAHFIQTYDRRYADFMTAIQEALTMIATCENQYGIRDWYRRFGFMYFEFMQQKYKRTD